VLSTIILREWQANDAACHQCMIYAAGWAFYGVQVAVLHRRREVWRRASWAAIQRHMSTELLFFYVVFTGSGADRREISSRRNRRQLDGSVPMRATSTSARRAAVEVGKTLSTPRSARASYTHTCELASYSLARGSPCSSAAANAAAAAVLPSMAAGGAAQLARAEVGWLQRDPVRWHPIATLRTVWRTAEVASEAPRALCVPSL